MSAKPRRETLPILPPGWSPPAGRRGIPESAAGPHASEHLREAVSVTTRGGDSQLEIQLGHLCNNRCVFCVSGQLTEQRFARRIPEQPVVAALDAAAAAGVRRVTLLGGEPTIQRSFLPVIRHAAGLGFDEIVIFTNGVRTAKRSFVEEVCALGAFTWRFSIQGGTEEAHDRVTQRPGSFARILAGLETLRSMDGQRVTANACINAFSHASLPAYVDLVERYGIAELHFDMIRPASAGLRSDAYHRAIQASYSEMATSFAAMLERFAARLPTFDVHVGNLPYCVLPDWTRAIHHGGEATATITTGDGGELGRVHDKYAHQREGMVHAPACADCVFRERCRGVPQRYAGDFGLDELRPVTAADRTARQRALAGILRRVRRVAPGEADDGGRIRAPRALRGGDGVWFDLEGADGEPRVRAVLRVEDGRAVAELHPTPGRSSDETAASLDALRRRLRGAAGR